MKNHDKFYSFAEAYDVAFDFKDVASEFAFLISAFEKHIGKPPKSFIDFLAGPALHSIEMAKRGLVLAAIDLSKEMVEYGLKKAKKQGVHIDYIQGICARSTLLINLISREILWILPLICLPTNRSFAI